MSLRREHMTDSNPYIFYRAVKKKAKKFSTRKLRTKLKREVEKNLSD